MYQSIIGSLLYIARTVKPEIMLTVNSLKQPGPDHITAIKRVMRYLNGSMDEKLTIKKSSNFGLDVIVDANFSERKETQHPFHSRSGIVIKLGDNLILSKSSIQRNITRSTAEAEFTSATM